MEGNSKWPREWSFEYGAATLLDDSAPEDRILDSISLLSTWYGDSVDEVVEALKPLMISGKTPKVRSEAVLGLSMLLHPASVAALRDSLPDLDESTRLVAERLVRAPGMARVEAGKVSTPDPDKALERTEKRMAKLSAKTLRTTRKLRKSLRYELEEVELAVEPAIVPDLAHGGFGYRLEIVPSNEEAATFSAWVGIQGIRYAIGPREASLRLRWATGITKRFWLVGGRSYFKSVANGLAREWIDPEGKESLVTLPLGPKEVEPFKTSSEVPEPQDVPAGWTEVEYPAYRSVTSNSDAAKHPANPQT